VTSDHHATRLRASGHHGPSSRRDASTTPFPAQPPGPRPRTYRPPSTNTTSSWRWAPEFRPRAPISCASPVPGARPGKSGRALEPLQFLATTGVSPLAPPLGEPPGGHPAITLSFSTCSRSLAWLMPWTASSKPRPRSALAGQQSTAGSREGAGIRESPKSATSRPDRRSARRCYIVPGHPWYESLVHPVTILSDACRSAGRGRRLAGRVHDLDLAGRDRPDLDHPSHRDLKKERHPH